MCTSASKYSLVYFFEFLNSFQLPTPIITKNTPIITPEIFALWKIDYIIVVVVKIYYISKSVSFIFTTMFDLKLLMNGPATKPQPIWNRQALSGCLAGTLACHDDVDGDADPFYKTPLSLTFNDPFQLMLTIIELLLLSAKIFLYWMWFCIIVSPLMPPFRGGWMVLLLLPLPLDHTICSFQLMSYCLFSKCGRKGEGYSHDMDIDAQKTGTFCKLIG